LQSGEFIVEWAFRVRSNGGRIGPTPVWTGCGYFEDLPEDMIVSKVASNIVRLVSDQFRETLDREIGRAFDTAKSENP
jgi:hypothetical protein